MTRNETWVMRALMGVLMGSGEGISKEEGGGFQPVTSGPGCVGMPLFAGWRSNFLTVSFAFPFLIEHNSLKCSE